MTTYPTDAVDPAHTAQDTQRADVPPLNPGDRLARSEFERCYLAHPVIKKAELIEGVVFIPLSDSIRNTGDHHVC